LEQVFLIIGLREMLDAGVMWKNYSGIDVFRNISSWMASGKEIMRKRLTGKIFGNARMHDPPSGSTLRAHPAPLYLKLMPKWALSPSRISSEGIPCTFLLPK